MSRTLLSAAVILALVCAAFSAGSAGQLSPDADVGRDLFSDGSFGSNGKSCDDCHADGDGLDELEGKKSSTVMTAVEKCLSERMGGPVPEHTSVQMKSLMLYLEEGEFIEIGC